MDRKLKKLEEEQRRLMKEIDKINDDILNNSKLFEVVDGDVREVNYERRI